MSRKNARDWWRAPQCSVGVAVDIGVTQVVDGNWSIHAIIKKSIFAGGAA
jgi:hypothetical protein